MESRVIIIAGSKVNYFRYRAHCPEEEFLSRFNHAQAITVPRSLSSLLCNTLIIEPFNFFLWTSGEARSRSGNN